MITPERKQQMLEERAEETYKSLLKDIPTVKGQTDQVIEWALMGLAKMEPIEACALIGCAIGRLAEFGDDLTRIYDRE